jgi:hypothetical protein
MDTSSGLKSRPHNITLDQAGGTVGLWESRGIKLEELVDFI